MTYFIHHPMRSAEYVFLLMGQSVKKLHFAVISFEDTVLFALHHLSGVE